MIKRYRSVITLHKMNSRLIEVPRKFLCKSVSSLIMCSTFPNCPHYPVRVLLITHQIIHSARLSLSPFNADIVSDATDATIDLKAKVPG